MPPSFDQLLEMGAICIFMTKFIWSKRWGRGEEGKGFIAQTKGLMNVDTVMGLWRKELQKEIRCRKLYKLRVERMK